MYVWASLSLSEPLWASLNLSGTLWAALGLSGPLRVSLGLSGPLWASLGLFGPPANQPASQPADQAASQPAKRMTGLFYPRTASLGQPGSQPARQAHDRLVLYTFGLVGPICVCMYVYMYVCMYVCMYVYVYVCRPLTHRGQVYQQLTYVLAGRFLKGPESRKKAFTGSFDQQLTDWKASPPASPPSP